MSIAETRTARAAAGLCPSCGERPHYKDRCPARNLLRDLERIKKKARKGWPEELLYFTFWRDGLEGLRARMARGEPPRFAVVAEINATALGII